MPPAISVLDRIYQNSKRNNKEVFTRVYRYLLRTDIYFTACKSLYNANPSERGLSGEKASLIIKALTNESYIPMIRNNKIPSNGLKTLTDDLVQEAVRLILEAVYEPVFCDSSHCFRPGRDCHTALSAIKDGFNGASWFIHGDIKGCFHNTRYSLIMEIIGKKIKDARFAQLLNKFMKAGCLENTRYCGNSIPYAGILTPFLMNIYFHELDIFIKGLKQEYETQSGGKTKRHSGEHFGKKEISYIRCADEFLIGVAGSKSDCKQIKESIEHFLGANLQIMHSEKRLRVTYSGEKVRFMGYDVRVLRGVRGRGKNRRASGEFTGTVELTIPFRDEIERLLLEKGAVKQINGKYRASHRKNLLRLPEHEIVSVYNNEVSDICNYYLMADNFNKLNYFIHLMEYSCLKTLAAKSKSTVRKVIHSHRDRRGGWYVSCNKQAEGKRIYFARLSDFETISGNGEPCTARAVRTVLREDGANLLSNTVRRPFPTLL